MYDLGSHFMVRGLTSVTPVLVACQTDVAFMRGACDDSDVLTIYSTTLVHVKHTSEPWRVHVDKFIVSLQYLFAQYGKPVSTIHVLTAISSCSL